MKRQFLSCAVVLLFTAFPFSKLFSNNLSVSNLSYDLPTSTVTFDLSWDNSWHYTTSKPNNWDAAWVIVKFRDCLAPASFQFTHGVVSTTLSDHNFHVSGPTTFEPTKRDGTVGIDASPNNTGVMLRNSATQTAGPVSATITLKVTNLPPPGSSLDIRVIGIEMVFVPQGEFLAGDNSQQSGNNRSYNFCLTPGNSQFPYFVTSENAQSIYEYSSGWCPGNTCNLSAAFPKGYSPYYIMKYEISQGLYVSFLNGTSTGVQAVHFLNQYNNYRNTIKDLGNDSLPFPFTCSVSGVSKDDRACNWLSWADVSAFLDWAALRPLTELEYEKACRGTLTSLFGEYAWGDNSSTQPYSFSGPEDGTETITTGGANHHYYNGGWSGGDGGYGPMRNGIFATASSTRAQAGMGYCGAMELSGNVNEYYVNAYAGTSGAPSETGVSLGDGYVGGNGNADVSNWPNPISPGSYLIQRGGGFLSNNYSDSYQWPVSYRKYIGVSYRYNDTGGRGGR